MIKPPLLEANATKHQVAFPIGCGRMPLRRHRSRNKAEILHCFLFFLQFVSGIWSVPIRFPIETLVAFGLQHSSFCFLPMGLALVASLVALPVTEALSALPVGFPIEMGMPLTTPLQIAAVFLLAW